MDKPKETCASCVYWFGTDSSYRGMCSHNNEKTEFDFSCPHYMSRILPPEVQASMQRWRNLIDGEWILKDDNSKIHLHFDMESKQLTISYDDVG